VRTLALEDRIAIERRSSVNRGGADVGNGDEYADGYDPLADLIHISYQAGRADAISEADLIEAQQSEIWQSRVIEAARDPAAALFERGNPGNSEDSA
jgi:hypothetical protein